MNENYHILIVDDDNRIRELIKEYLEEKNFIVSTANDAEEASEKIKLVDFEIDLGFDVFMKVRTRLVDVDTPERGQKDYKEATEFLKNLIVKARDEEGYNKIRTYKTGKYGRWLVTIDGDVNKEMASIWPYKK